MKFDAKYPDKTNAQKLFPEKLIGPHKEVEVTSEITQSWRVYPCGVCRSPTGWRFNAPKADHPATPACSEECVSAMKADATAEDPPPSEDGTSAQLPGSALESGVFAPPTAK
jgi:hypothetical protein